MPIVAELNENYDGRRTDFDKSKLLKKIEITGDDLTASDLERRKNFFSIEYDYGNAPITFYTHKPAAEIKRDAKDFNKSGRYPLVVISRNRSEWIGNEFNKLEKSKKTLTDFGDEGFNNSSAFKNNLIVPWYHPRRSKRPLYVIVHSSEYISYRAKLENPKDNIIVVGFDIRQSAGDYLSENKKLNIHNSLEFYPILSGGGIYKYAAMALMFALDYGKSWFVDDDVIHVNNFPNTLDKIEEYVNNSSIVALTFPSSSGELNKIQGKILRDKLKEEKIKMHNDSQFNTSANEFTGPEVLRQVVLWNIAILKEWKINYCPFFVFHHDLAFTNCIKNKLGKDNDKILLFKGGNSSSAVSIVTFYIPQDSKENDFAGNSQYMYSEFIENIESLEDSIDITIRKNEAGSAEKLKLVLNQDWLKKRNLIWIDKLSAIVSAREQWLAESLKKIELSKIDKYLDLYNSDDDKVPNFRSLGSVTLSRGKYYVGFSKRGIFSRDLEAGYYKDDYYWRWNMKQEEKNRDLPQMFTYKFVFDKHHIIPGNMLIKFMSMIFAKPAYTNLANKFLNQIKDNYINSRVEREIWKKKYEIYATRLIAQAPAESWIKSENWDSSKVAAVINPKYIKEIAEREIHQVDKLKEEIKKEVRESLEYNNLEKLIKNIFSVDRSKIYIFDIKEYPDERPSSPNGWDELYNSIFWMPGNLFWGPTGGVQKGSVITGRVDDPGEKFEYCSKNIIGEKKYNSDYDLYEKFNKFIILNAQRPNADPEKRQEHEAELEKKFTEIVEKFTEIAAVPVFTDMDKDKWRPALMMGKDEFDAKFQSEQSIEQMRSNAQREQDAGKLWGVRMRIKPTPGQRFDSYGKGEVVCGPLQIPTGYNPKENPDPDNKSKTISGRFYLYLSSEKKFVTDIEESDREDMRYSPHSNDDNSFHYNDRT